MIKVIQKLLDYQQLADDGKAILFIFKWVDEQLGKNNLQLINLFLEQIDVTQFGEDILVGIMTATYPLRSLLGNREKFVCASFDHLEKIIGKDAIEGLMELK